MTTEPVSVLGLGLMGATLARTFVIAGHDVTVWNRSPGRAEPFADTAAVATSAGAACAAGPLTVVCLADQAACREVLETPDVEEALRDRTLVQLTTGTPSDARRNAAWAAGHGIGYLDGAIWEYPAGIGGAETALVYSGPAELFRRHEPVLRALGGATAHVGETIGAAAVYDCAMLIGYYGASLSFLCSAALCDAEGIAPKEFLAIFERLAPVIAHSHALAVEQIAASEYPGDDCRMAVHAAAAPVMLRAARESGIDVGLHAAIGSLIERTLELGHRDSSLASIFTAARSGGPVWAMTDRTV